MNRIFMLERTDEIEYDEDYRMIVIEAPDVLTAIDNAREFLRSFRNCSCVDIKVTELNLNEPRMLQLIQIILNKEIIGNKGD